ncbi:MAG: TIGR04255 family protein [Chloroflexi bacterium]|nr:TIGR04255 family protein [Chloroflexota bacterium]
MSTLLELIGLPKYERLVYQNPPLAQVICQVRFRRLLAVADKAAIGRVQQSFRSRYPKLTETQGLELGIQSGPGGARLDQPHLWQFSDEEDNWKVIIAEEFLALDTHRYADFEDFLGRLNEALSIFVENVGPPEVLRTGLRYINEIRTDPPDWTRVISGDLLGPLLSPELGKGTGQIQAVQQIQLRYPGQQGINIIHGAFPEGTTIAIAQAQQPPTVPFYLLDFDVYREYSSGEPINVEEICRNIGEANKAIYRLFRWSVTDEFISAMEVR